MQFALLTCRVHNFLTPHNMATLMVPLVMFTGSSLGKMFLPVLSVGPLHVASTEGKQIETTNHQTVYTIPW